MVLLKLVYYFSTLCVRGYLKHSQKVWTFDRKAPTLSTGLQESQTAYPNLQLTSPVKVNSPGRHSFELLIVAWLTKIMRK